MSFAYRIVRADTAALLVSASTSLVSINREGRLVALPREVRTWLESAMQGRILSQDGAA